MKLIRYVADNHPPCVATIGNFDGLHRGHQTLLQRVQAIAQEEQLAHTVISFEPLPNEYFLAANAPSRIYPLRDKLRLLQQLNVEQFACFNFKHIAELSAEAFIEAILFRGLQVKYLIVGDDFRFGRGRTGNFQLLKTMGEQVGVQVWDTQTITHNQTRISSTRIRAALESADLIQTNTLLGHSYQLSGRVRHGDKLGRTINFPTLNLQVHPKLALKKGVYTVWVTGLGHKRRAGVANLGKRPTVNGDELRFEVHLLDFDQEVYGQHVLVEPLNFIRPEQKFNEFAALQQQIHKDVQSAKQFFQTMTY